MIESALQVNKAAEVLITLKGHDDRDPDDHVTAEVLIDTLSAPAFTIGASFMAGVRTAIVTCATLVSPESDAVRRNT